MNYGWCLCRRFIRARNGNVAMMFGLLLIPLLIGAGVGLDMVRAAQVRAKLTEAADSGLLAAARAMMTDGTLSTTEAQALARRYFDANGEFDSRIVIDTFNFEENTIEELYRLTVTGRIETTILGITGQKYMPVNILSEAKIAPPRILEAVLVLDNTYSMSGSKMSTLIDAAEDLVDTIMADTDNQVKVGLVPFSQYVNVGLSRRSEPWLDVEDDYTETVHDPDYCYNTYPDSTRTCTSESNTCTRTKDGVTETYSCTTSTCTGDLGDPVPVCEPRDLTYSYTWRGCVGSRPDPYDIEDRDYDIELVPGLLNKYCAQEITPLTTDKAAIIADVRSMAVQGSYTYIPAGFVWGYRMISSIEPLSEAITYAEREDQNGIKAIILMTDGANTRSAASDGDHDGNDIDLANRTLEDQCKEAKEQGIMVYTIAFEVLDSTIRDLLEDCASSTGNYYNATNSTSLVDAFDAIGNSLTELALD